MQRKFILAIKRLCYLNLIMVWSGVVVWIKIKWSEDINISKHTYNARHETIFQKPSFQDAAYKCNLV